MFADRPESFVPLPQPARPRLWRLRDLAAGLVLLVLAFLAVVVGLAIAGTRGMTPGVVATFAFEFALGGIVLVLAVRRGITLRALGFVAPLSWWPAIVAWLGSYGVLGLYALALWALERLGIDVSRFQGGNPLPIEQGATPALLAALGVMVVLVAPPCEELFFRAFVFRAVRGYRGFLFAALVSGLAFSLFHLNAAVIVPFALIGALFAWSMEASGSLWTSIVAHALVNSLSYVVSLGPGSQ